MTIQIREHTPGKDIEDFIRVGHVVYGDDPNWVPPLEFDLRQRLTPGKNPFFHRGEVGLFTAWKDGKLVGRISAQLDHIHLDRYKDKPGFFGFFDTIDDDAVGKALLDAAEAWLEKRGMVRMRGPLTFHMYEEAGVLIDGFDMPPQILMAHTRPWQQRVCENNGLVKAKDLFAWRFDVGKIPERAEKAWAEVKKMPEVKLRSVRRMEMQKELAAIMRIFNDAWEQNWGHCPASEEEVKKTGEDLLLILDPELAFIAEVDGKPVGMCIAVPNLNEVIRDFDGKLNPVTVAKLLYRLKLKGPKTARLMMLGISKDVRGMKKYGYLSHALYVEVAKRGEKLGYEWGELSWTLEDNKPINLGIKSMGAKIYKTYRIYERPIRNAAAVAGE
jgi:GNAT superfamily N-acetyltransferase